MSSKFNRRHPIGKENIKNAGDNVARPRSALPGKEVGEVGNVAKAAPDFGKLHKQWDRKLAKGKAVKKKPLTSIQPFQLQTSKLPNRTNTHVENKFDHGNSKENTLTWNSAANNTKSNTTSRVPAVKTGIPRLQKPLSQLQQTVSRIQPPPKPPPKVQQKTQFSSKIQPPKIQQPTKHSIISNVENKSAVISNVVKPVIVTDSTKLTAKQSEHLKPPPNAEIKSSANQSHSIAAQDFKIDFKCDDAALDSILNGEGIELPTKSPSRCSSQVGPARRDKGGQRVVPFTKPAGNRLSLNNRLSMSYAEQNTAKKRWSIYNRDSFSTKTDLMTWLQNLAGVSSASSSVTTATTTTTAPADSGNLCVVSDSVVSSSLIVPSQTSATSTKITQITACNSASTVPVESQSDVSINAPIKNAATSTKFGHSVAAFPTLEEEVEEENTTNCDKVEEETKPLIKKSILKKSTLMSIEEIQKKTMEVKAEIMETKKEVRTPRRGKKMVSRASDVEECRQEKILEARTPTRGVRKAAPPKERKGFDADTPGKLSQLSKNIRNPSRTPLRSAQRAKQVAKQMLASPAQSSTPRKTIEEANLMDESCLLSTKKRVHWNSDLTYLSPVENSPADDLNEENMLDRECAMQLFCNDETVMDDPIDKVEEKMDLSVSQNIPSSASTCLLGPPIETNEVCITDSSNMNNKVRSGDTTVKSNNNTVSIMSNNNDYKIPVCTSAANLLSMLSPASTIPVNDVILIPSLPKVVVPSTSGMKTTQSDQVLLNLFDSPLNNVGSLESNSKSEVVISSSNNLNSWADILGNICGTCSPATPSCSSSVLADVLSSSLIRTPTTPAQKAKKKKRCSILEQIYGGSGRSGDPSAEKKSAQSNIFHNSMSSSQCVSADLHKSPYNLRPKSTNGCSLRVIASENNVMGSPAILRRNVKVSHNPSTVVTYSKNVHNVLYGDNKHPQSPLPRRAPKVESGSSSGESRVPTSDNLSQPSHFPLITFSNEKKDQLDKSLGKEVDLSLLLNNSMVSAIGMTPIRPQSLSTKATVTGVGSPIVREEISQDIPKGDSSTGKHDQSSCLLLDSSSLSFGTTPIRPLNVVTSSNSKDTVETSESRSAQLEKYVTTLLNSPPHSQQTTITSGGKELLESQSMSALNITEPCSTHITCTTISSTTNNVSLDSSDNDSDDNASYNNSDDDVCIVFSTPFKRGLYNHIVQSSSFIGVRKGAGASDVDTTLKHSTKPSTPTNPIHCSASSAFRRILPKNIEPTPLSARMQSSEEMILLTREVLPTSLRALDPELDAEVSWLLQNVKGMSCFLSDDVSYRSINPISVVLSVGDDMHFLPIHGEAEAEDLGGV